MEHQERLALIGYLSGFVTEERKNRFAEVLSHRTAFMRIVLEDVYQGHNASAVLRSCDCFGVQHVHFIENRNRLRISDEVAMGSSQWLTIHRHRGDGTNTAAALEGLKKEGYRIVAVTPHTNGFNVADLPVVSKFALVFGTEMQGISAEAAALADQHVKIPMFGFTESFNVSVCAALCMYELTARARGQEGYPLGDEEKSEVLLSWLKSSISTSEAIIADYLKKKKI
jgi:tRNA (guanosine-2'-O-)-methyltransferase